MAEQENQNMCERCGERPASCTVAVRMGNQIRHQRLCQVCLGQVNKHLSTGDVAKVIGAIMGALTGKEPGKIPVFMPKPAPKGPVLTQEDHAIVCPGCGATQAQVIQTMKVGCAGCYAAFREKLRQALQQENSRVEYLGRRPIQDEATRQHRSTIAQLTSRMAAAIAQEDYETAARLRDQLRALDREGGAGNGQ